MWESQSHLLLPGHLLSTRNSPFPSCPTASARKSLILGFSAAVPWLWVLVATQCRLPPARILSVWAVSPVPCTPHLIPWPDP